MRTLQRLITTAALAYAFLVAAGPARASDLRKELAEVAKEIKKLLDGQGENSIAVGQITGPPNFPASSGPGIAQVLVEELRRLGIEVPQVHKFGIAGKYHPTEVPDPDPNARPGAKVLAVELKLWVEDRSGTALANFNFKITANREAHFVELLGVPAHLDGPNAGARDKSLRESYENPDVHAQGSRIAAAKDSPFAVEILVNGRARKAEKKDGLAFVPLERGDSYAVRLINDSPHDAAVRLSIDGLSMFAFSELRQPDTLPGGKPNPRRGEPLFNVVIVPKHSKVEILGWHRNNKDTDRFLVTEYAKSAAATIYHKAGVGTITATFAAAWDPNRQNPPPDEPPFARGDPNATGFGERVHAPFVEVQRRVGAVRASVSVRYSK